DVVSLDCDIDGRAEEHRESGRPVVRHQHGEQLLASPPYSLVIANPELRARSVADNQVIREQIFVANFCSAATSGFCPTSTCRSICHGPLAATRTVLGDPPGWVYAASHTAERFLLS